MKIFKKEKEVAELALQYLGIAEECVRSCGNTLEAYLNGQSEEAATHRLRASELESEADQLRRDIGDKLYSGAYLPLLRGDIYSLIDSLDRVPNAAEACASFLLSERPAIPDEFKDRFQAVARASLGIIEPLHEVVRAFFKPKGKIDAIREQHKSVGVRESEVDQLEWDLTVAVYDSSLDLAVKHHLKKALDRIVHVSDRAEDWADQLELVALKSVL